MVLASADFTMQSIAQIGLQPGSLEIPPYTNLASYSTSLPIEWTQLLLALGRQSLDAGQIYLMDVS
jgi:hypothetical protein